MSKKVVKKEVEAELIEEPETIEGAVEEQPEEGFFDKLDGLSNTSLALLAGAGLLLVVVFVSMAAGPGSVPVEALSQSSVVEMPAAAMAKPLTESTEGIERQGEGRHFFTTIKIPPSATTLYLSGSGASQKADGAWGSMEEQTIDTFSKFRQTLEAQGWSMSDIVQVRAFAVAGEYGLLDFDGFNRGYRQFFGTEANPQKPVRSFVQVADLVVPGWLVEIEIRAAKI